MTCAVRFQCGRIGFALELRDARAVEFERDIPTSTIPPRWLAPEAVALKGRPDWTASQA